MIDRNSSTPDPQAPVNADSLLSGALCMALAFINRQRGASSDDIGGAGSNASLRDHT